MKKLLTLYIALWVLLTCMVTVSSAHPPPNPFEVLPHVDVVPYAETRIWADGDAEPLWAVGVRTEVKNLWKGVEIYLGIETGQATTEQSKIHGCNIFNGCSLDAMTNTVKEDDTYWSFKGGIQYRFNLLGK